MTDRWRLAAAMTRPIRGPSSWAGINATTVPRCPEPIVVTPPMLRAACHEPESLFAFGVTPAATAAEEPRGMILVGARFRALAGARAALRAVRASVPVVPADVGVRPLGTTRYDSPIDDFVLAGRFEPGDVESVIRILHAHGGRVVIRRLDSSTAATSATPAPATASDAPRSPAARRAASRFRPSTRGLSRTRLRRPSPPLRVRTARSHRIEG
jgi:hypothetical protein